jgi:hypothetical protein
MHPVRRLAALLLVAFACGPAAAVAQVYKCAGDGGVPMYQDAPCAPGQELRNFAADPANVSVLPLRPPAGTTTRQSSPAPVKARTAAASERKEKSRSGGDPAERRHLHPGMQEGEVLARAGPPDMKSGGGGRKVARWTYMPSQGDPQTLTTVVFEYGKVVEVERTVMR